MPFFHFVSLSLAHNCYVGCYNFDTFLFSKVSRHQATYDGSKLEESLRASEKRISQEAKNMWRHNVHNAVAYFKYKSEDGVVISDHPLICT